MKGPSNCSFHEIYGESNSAKRGSCPNRAGGGSSSRTRLAWPTLPSQTEGLLPVWPGIWLGHNVFGDHSQWRDPEWKVLVTGIQNSTGVVLGKQKNAFVQSSQTCVRCFQQIVLYSVLDGAIRLRPSKVIRSPRISSSDPSSWEI